MIKGAQGHLANGAIDPHSFHVIDEFFGVKGSRLLVCTENKFGGKKSVDCPDSGFALICSLELVDKILVCGSFRVIEEIVGCSNDAFGCIQAKWFQR